MVDVKPMLYDCPRRRRQKASAAGGEAKAVNDEDALAVLHERSVRRLQGNSPRKSGDSPRKSGDIEQKSEPATPSEPGTPVADAPPPPPGAAATTWGKALLWEQHCDDWLRGCGHEPMSPTSPGRASVRAPPWQIEHARHIHVSARLGSASAGRTVSDQAMYFGGHGEQPAFFASPTSAAIVSPPGGAISDVTGLSPSRKWHGLHDHVADRSESEALLHKTLDEQAEVAEREKQQEALDATRVKTRFSRHSMV